MPSVPTILSIAGFDPSAGAGVMADIKTAEAQGVYAYGVMTSLTYQNEAEFDDVDWLKTEHIIRQIRVLQKRHSFDAIKIGLIGDLKTMLTVVSFLQDTCKDVPIVWDPILAASSGYPFHDVDDTEAWFAILKDILLITPNKPEAEQIFKTNDETKIRRIIANRFLSNVLIKGGHAEGDQCNDILVTASEKYVFEGQRYDGYQKHGTGCVLSTAITCNLAKGMSLIEACRRAKGYVSRVLTSNNSLLGYHYMSM